MRFLHKFVGNRIRKIICRHQMIYYNGRQCKPYGYSSFVNTIFDVCVCCAIHKITILHYSNDVNIHVIIVDNTCTSIIFLIIESLIIMILIIIIIIGILY